ncbi:MAG: hypothetical protein KKC68_06540 [Candidatus Thermoplasmatota archaeon]|nr:hypothetical protein [Candidatus Thermoplasmatota archaeon]MBU1941417.1 hypothetical protein [Candidatus Thermoplasmatota archaeon]
MNIKSRHQILTDIITDAKKHSSGWKAAIGSDPHIHSKDYYIFHPHVGCYMIKEFEKNPFHRIGVGGKIARHIDEDIHQSISETSGDFGIIQGDMKKLIQSIQQGYDPSQILHEALQGNDRGLSVPVKGKAETHQESFSYLRDCFREKQKPLDRKLEKLLTNEGAYISYD